LPIVKWRREKARVSEWYEEENVSVRVHNSHRHRGGNEAEATVKFSEISGPQASGLYYSLKLPALEGTPIHMTTCALSTGSTFLIFTTVTQGEQSDSLKDALAAVRSATHISTVTVLVSS
jgi:hypothetical protein